MKPGPIQRIKVKDLCDLIPVTLAGGHNIDLPATIEGARHRRHTVAAVLYEKIIEISEKNDLEPSDLLDLLKSAKIASELEREATGDGEKTTIPNMGQHKSSALHGVFKGIEYLAKNAQKDLNNEEFDKLLKTGVEKMADGGESEYDPEKDDTVIEVDDGDND